MILFYIDEAGNPYPHSEPLFDGQTPIFCLSAVAVEAGRWRALDRALLALKRAYFQKEMEAFGLRHPELGSEQFEVKGKHLCKPSSARIYRNRVFVHKVLGIVEAHEGRLFAAIWRKDPLNPSSSVSIYTHSLQVLAERFHYHCQAMNDRGLLIIDSRTKALDNTVAAGHLSFLFGHPVGRTYTTLVEAPLFADSKLSAGVQYADIIGACIYGRYYYRRCSGIAGHFEGTQPISAERYAEMPPTARLQRTPARDYQRSLEFWTQIKTLEFRRTDVAAPLVGQVVPGYYGFRELKHLGE